MGQSTRDGTGMADDAPLALAEPLPLSPSLPSGLIDENKTDSMPVALSGLVEHHTDGALGIGRKREESRDEIPVCDPCLSQ